MGQRSIRFPDEFEARLAALAEADGRTFSNYVLRTLEKALGDSSTVEPHKRREPNSRVAGSTPARPAPPRTSEKAKQTRKAGGTWTQAEVVASIESQPQRLGKGFVPPRPKGK